MTKVFLAILAMLAASTALADNPAIERYIAAQIAMLETQVDELHQAISLMKTENLSETDKFERIGKPGFAAVDRSLAEKGFTPKQFYQFGYDHQREIDQWLVEHADFADRIQSLQAEQADLIVEYDQMNNVNHGD